MREARLTRKESGEVIMSRCFVTENSLERMRGLLGRQSLASDEALWIQPCNNVHTFFMKFSIDVVFMNSQGRILKIYSSMKPWKTHWPVWKASIALEMPEGASSKLREGDCLCLS